MEIDEYQQYEKAGSALVEAHKSLTTAVNHGDEEAREKLSQLQFKLEKTRQFLQLKK